MGKKTSYPRVEYRRLRRAWVSRNRGLVAALTGGLVVICGVEIVLLRAFLPAPQSGYLIAAMLTAAVFVFAWALQTLFLASSGTAIHQLRGSWGEDNTTSELKAARRQGLLWHAIHSIALEKGDIDHFVITRRGGVVVVDSKWCSDLDDEKRATLAFTARRAAQRGEGLVNTVTRRSHGRHSAPRAPMVTPVVVVWGAAQSSVRDDDVVDGVAIVAGSRFRTWLAQLEVETISQGHADDLAEQIETFDATRRETVRDRAHKAGASVRA